MTGAPEAETLLSDPDCDTAWLRASKSELIHFDQPETGFAVLGAASPASHGGE